MDLVGLNITAGIIALGLGIIGFLMWKFWPRKKQKGVPAPSQAAAIPLPPLPANKFPALIITPDGKWHFGRIPEPCGALFTCDTTMPEPGDHYWVRELQTVKILDDGTRLADITYQPYDPRTAEIITNQTPEDAFRKTQDWQKDIPYVDEEGLWEKLPMIAMYIMLFLTFIGVVIYLGK